MLLAIRRMMLVHADHYNGAVVKRQAVRLQQSDTLGTRQFRHVVSQHVHVDDLLRWNINRHSFCCVQPQRWKVWLRHKTVIVQALFVAHGYRFAATQTTKVTNRSHFGTEHKPILQYLLTYLLTFYTKKRRPCFDCNSGSDTFQCT